MSGISNSNCDRAFSPARLSGRPRGFTLSEVMIVVVLLSIVTQAVYQFYAVGVRSYKNSQIHAETVGSIRYLKKLIEEKIQFKSNNNHNIFMRKEGFLAVGSLGSIMVGTLEGTNLPLYNKLGFSQYLTHASLNVEECTMEVLVKKLSALGYVYNGDFRGSYVSEIVKNTASVSDGIFSFSFGSKPSNMLGGSFLGDQDSVTLSASANPAATVEINTSAVRDLTYLFDGAGAGQVDVLMNARKYDASVRPLFTLFSSFDQKQVPGFLPGTNVTAQDKKNYFITGTNLFCDDGMMFYEEDTSGALINHAFYVKTPITDEAELDDEGNVLKQIRYSFARNEGGEYKYVDDTVISNVEKISLSYFDKNGVQIACDKNFWEWHRGDEIYSININ
ncbi:MAG TPA: prepilin-type N-terminal cleavage/methylation domain-containing protein, partial [Candidatus Wallbacteria bacterium]|nr:prepilin-type N-terminal cleavage/methylation domain-containing protein [Candidatus Wallbacteria bacterium]